MLKFTKFNSKTATDITDMAEISCVKMIKLKAFDDSVNQLKRNLLENKIQVTI